MTSQQKALMEREMRGDAVGCPVELPYDWRSASQWALTRANGPSRFSNDYAWHWCWMPNFGPHSPLKSLAGAHPEVYWTIWLGLVNSNKLFANSKFVEEKSKTISYFKFCFPLCAELCSRLPEGSREFQGLPGSSHRNHWTFQASWQHLRPFLLLPN